MKVKNAFLTKTDHKLQINEVLFINLQLAIILYA